MERLEASGYDVPASEIEAGMELYLPFLVKVGKGNNGYKAIEEFLLLLTVAPLVVGAQRIPYFFQRGPEPL